IVRPADVAFDAGHFFDGTLRCNAERHSQDGQRVWGKLRAEDDRHIEPTSFGMPGVAVASDAGGLFFGDNGCAVRFAAECQRGCVLHRGGRGAQPDLHNKVSLKLMSTAFAEWVMAPEETK